VIRFRLVEDERRYLALRAELYLRLSQSGADMRVVADVLRNLGKIESFAYSEGIRQGAVAQACATSRPRPALGLHRDFYGSADTPLREVEKAKRPDCEGGIFEEDPLEFAPLTLGEAKKHYRRDEPLDEAPFAEAPPPRLAEARPDHFSVNTGDPDLDAELADALAPRRPASDPTVNEHLYAAPSPDFIDRLRDALLAARSNGTGFADWSEMVLHLQRFTGCDAGAIDLQLSTDEGRTALAQAGYFDLAPGEYLEMAQFLDKLDERT
jgi:hypothetical protein